MSTQMVDRWNEPDIPTVRFENYSYKYPGMPIPALREIDLDIHRKEFILIAGESGSGKSTLAKALCGYLFEGGKEKGGILIDGKSCKKVEPYKRALLAGYVQQDPDSQLVTLNVREEVAFGPENLKLPASEIERRVEESLKVVKAEHLANRDTLTLSGGEKQKVAIASILAMRPRLIILDEPTASLDPGSTRELTEAIVHMKRELDATTIILEHRLDTFLPLADRLIVLKDGRKALDGVPDNVMDRDSKLLGRLGIRVPGSLRIPPRPIDAKPAGAGPLLQVKNLTFHRDSRKILDDISFCLNGGEIAALMGDNGSGKTTLALNVMGILKPTSGTVAVNGRRVRHGKTSRTARDVGLVFQNPNNQLFEGTIQDEILFAPRNFKLPKAEEKTRETIKEFGFKSREKESPHRLSHGEKRRLTLASVDVYRPKVYVLDEAFIGQDLKRLRMIANSIQNAAARGAAMLLVLHDPELVKGLCSRILFLEKGKLVVDSDIKSGFEKLSGIGKEEYLPIDLQKEAGLQ